MGLEISAQAVSCGTFNIVVKEERRRMAFSTPEEGFRTMGRYSPSPPPGPVL